MQCFSSCWQCSRFPRRVVAAAMRMPLRTPAIMLESQHRCQRRTFGDRPSKLVTVQIRPARPLRKGDAHRSRSANDPYGCRRAVERRRGTSAPLAPRCCSSSPRRRRSAPFACCPLCCATRCDATRRDTTRCGVMIHVRTHRHLSRNRAAPSEVSLCMPLYPFMSHSRTLYPLMCL